MPEKTLYQIDFGYGTKVTTDQLNQIKKYFPSATFHPKEHFKISSWDRDKEPYKDWTPEQFETDMNENYEKYLSNESREFDLDYQQLKEYIDLESFLTDCPDIQINIKSRKVIKFSQPTESFSLLEYQSMFRTLEKLSNQLDNRDPFSSHCNVHINGNHLMSINTLMLCEDACTDLIQAQLNEGWKIIAVCAQDTRRPDYILGKIDQGIKPERALRP